MNLPPYKDFPILASSEILLRQVEESDLHDLRPICYYDGKAAINFQQAFEMQQKIEKDSLDGETVHWVITARETGELLGTCGFYRGFTGETGEIGCVLLESSRGRGVMTKALQLVINFGFEKMGLRKISAITSPNNKKSQALLSRLRFDAAGKTSDGDLSFVLLKKAK